MARSRDAGVVSHGRLGYLCRAPHGKGEPLAEIAAQHADRVLAVLRASDESANPATSPEIAASWRRCLLNHHLDPERMDPPILLSGVELRHARDYSGRLLRAADPELERLHALVSGLGYSVLLTDSSGTVVARRGREGDEDGCRRRGLWTGALWSEDVEGTNGVGTCLAEQRPVTIHRDQHFRRRHTQLTCTVAPVYNAMGQVAGALDTSSFRPDPTGRILPLVMAAVRETARRIEQSSFRAFFSHHLILALPENLELHSVPLLALDADRRIVGATHAARLALRLDDTILAGSIAVSDLLGTIPPSDPGSFTEAERAVVTGALAQAQGNVTAAAAALGISRATLHRKIRRLQLERHHRVRQF
jgi:transcriptional regulator of acetoin/glycerol metabolism